MSRVRDKNGNVIELGGEDLERALRSGAVTPVAGEAAPQIETESGRQAYDPSVLQEGIHGADFTPVGPQDSIDAREQAFYEDKYGGTDGAVGAVAAGAARSLTFGGSDVLLDQMGFGNDLAKLKEINPTLSTIGEVGGAVIPGVFSGGSSTLARLLAKTPAGALSKAASKLGYVRGGALEGAAFGAGQGVSNLAISNEPLTAEAVFSELGTGAIYGASVGAAMGGLAHGLDKSAKFLKGRAVARAEREALAEADHLAQRAEDLSRLGFKTETVTKHLNDTVEDLIDTSARVAQGSDIVGSPRQLRQWALEGHAARLEAFGELHERATALGVSQRTLGPIKDKIHQSLKLARTHVDPKGLRIDTKSFDGARKSLNRADNGLAELALRIDKATNLPPKTTYRAIAQRLDDLDDKFHAMTGSGGKAPRMSAYTGVPPTVVARAPDPELATILQEVQEARKAFHADWGLKNTDVINETVWKRFEKFDPERATAATASRANYYKTLDKLAGRVPNAEFKTALDLGTKEYKAALAEMTPTASPGESANELMSSLGMMAGSTLVPDMDGPLDDALRIYLQGRALKGAFHAGGVGAGRRTPWTVNAASNAARRATYKAMPGGSGFFGSAAGGAASSMAAAGVRAIAMGGTQMAHATGKAIARIENAMNKLAAKSAKASRRSIPGVATVLGGASFGDSEDDGKKTPFKRRSEELAQAMSNPTATQQRIHDNLTDIRAVHPKVADTMEIQAMKTLGFLYDKMPKDPGTVMSLGKSRWVPDELAVAKWANYVRAVSDPVSVIEDAANGTITPQGAEVLRVLYPATYAEVQNRLWQRLPEMQENSTYDQRIRLSILFKVPLESTMDPKMKGFIQRRFADENAEQQEPLDTSGMKPEQPTLAQSILPTGIV